MGKSNGLVTWYPNASFPLKSPIIHSDTKPSTTAFHTYHIQCYCPLPSQLCSVPETPCQPPTLVSYTQHVLTVPIWFFFYYYSITDTHVNTVDLQLNTCHLLHPVWVIVINLMIEVTLWPFLLHLQYGYRNYKLGNYPRAPHHQGPRKNPGSLCVVSVFSVELFFIPQVLLGF